MDKNFPSQKKTYPKDSFTKKIGDKIEDLSKKIYQKGSRIEHSRDKP